ncbi:MAG: type II toxin-antitoxin system prevent-host-death family antitoxin [Actinomycetota bacterium]
MGEVTIRELRNHGGDVVDRVAAGERLLVTRSGTPVAELRPLERTPLPLHVVIRHRQGVPDVDPDALRRQVDELIDPGL